MHRYRTDHIIELPALQQAHAEHHHNSGSSPVSRANKGDMLAQPAVMPTRLPSEPFTVAVSSTGLEVLRYARKAPNAPAEAAK